MQLRKPLTTIRMQRKAKDYLVTPSHTVFPRIRSVTCQWSETRCEPRSQKKKAAAARCSRWSFIWPRCPSLARPLRSDQMWWEPVLATILQICSPNTSSVRSATPRMPVRTLFPSQPTPRERPLIWLENSSSASAPTRTAVMFVSLFHSIDVFLDSLQYRSMLGGHRLSSPRVRQEQRHYQDRLYQPQSISRLFETCCNSRGFTIAVFACETLAASSASRCKLHPHSSGRVIIFPIPCF